jgi:hypothetical protein
MKILYYNDKKLEQMKPAHLDSLVELVREAWDKDATVESYLAARALQFVQNPFMNEHGYPIILLVDNDKVIGQCNSTPCKAWAGKRELTMFWNAGLHLLPECRGKGLGIVLPAELTRRLPIISGFFVVPQQLKTHKKLGYHIVGKIPDYIKVYKPVRFLMQIDIENIRQIPAILRKLLRRDNKFFRVPFSWIGAACIMLFHYIKKKLRGIESDKKITFSFVDEFDVRVDQLWDKMKEKIQFAQVRNAAYMNWQFKASQGWKKLIMEENGDVVGFALIALRRNDEKDRLAGLKLVSTIDLFWDFEKNDIIEHYLRFMDMYAKREGADIAFCSINNKIAIQRLKMHGYFKIPDSVYFVVRSQRGDVHLSGRLEDWFLTRGDADAAGSLSPNI